MSTSVPAAFADEAPTPRPLPLVHRVFGEPRFHTEGDIAAIAFAADGSLFSVDEAGVLRHWAPDGRQLSRHFLVERERLAELGGGAARLGNAGRVRDADDALPREGHVDHFQRVMLTRVPAPTRDSCA